MFWYPPPHHPNFSKSHCYQLASGNLVFQVSSSRPSSNLGIPKVPTAMHEVTVTQIDWSRLDRKKRWLRQMDQVTQLFWQQQGMIMLSNFGKLTVEFVIGQSSIQTLYP